MTRYYREVVPIGEKVGLVTIKKRLHLGGKDGRLYLCICECGKEIIRPSERLIAGNVFPCMDCVKKYHLRFGETLAKEYDIIYN